MCVVLHLGDSVPSLGAAQRMCWLQNSVGHTLLFFHQISASKDEYGNFSSRWHFAKSSLNFRNSNKYWKRKLIVGKYCNIVWTLLAALSVVEISFLFSVQSLSRAQLFATPWIAARQASRPSPTPGVHTNSRPSSQWCHPAISSSVIPFSSCPQSFPASGSFPMSQHFAWGGQSTGVSALASFSPKKSQGWSPSE